MKKNNLFLFGLVILFVFNSCEKDDDNVNLAGNLMKYKEWNALKFVVNNENTMLPDTSYILDAPVSYVKIKFIDMTHMSIELELFYSDGRTDNSGELKMTYLINETDSTITINDNNWWTESASFTGVHKILDIQNNNLTLNGKLGDDLNYTMILKGK